MVGLRWATPPGVDCAGSLGVFNEAADEEERSLHDDLMDDEDDGGGNTRPR